MQLSALTVFIFVANGTAATVATAMTLLVLLQAPRDRDNQLMAAYFLAVMLWSTVIFFSRLVGALGGDPTPLFLTTFVGTGLTSFTLFALVSHYAGLWGSRWVVACLVSGLLVTAASTHLLYAGRIVQFLGYAPDGLMHYRLFPPGYAVLSYYLALNLAALVCLWVYRRGRAGILLVGGAIASLAVLLSGFVPALRPYPLPAAAAAISSILFARAILREKLFNPLAALNRDLAEANQRLRESEANLLAVLETTRSGIWSVDRNLRLLTANSAIRTLWRRTYRMDAYTGMSVLERLEPQRRARWLHLYERALGGENFTEEEHEELGDFVADVEVSMTPIHGEDGSIRGVAAFGRDVTQRKRTDAELHAAKEAAEAANRAKSDFLARVSHELRTPLNGILGYAQILRRDRGLSAEQQEGLAVIQKSGEHLLHLITDILDLSTIEARKMELQPVVFDLREFLDAVGRPFRVRAGQTDLGFRSEIAANVPRTVLGDERRLRQVLINLLGNAFQYTESGSVTFRVWPDRDEVRFEVEDTGHGIAPEQREQLFEPFGRVPGSQRSGESTGLGLAISRDLVRLMGGELDLKSEPGKGSVFSFGVRLPQAQGRPARVPTEWQAVTGYEGAPRTILVVDDDDQCRSVLASFLSPLGFHVLEAGDGNDGLALAGARPPDVVLVDLMMPGMNGLELTARLRRQPGCERVPIVAITASAFDRDRNAALAAGCSAFLAKPIREEDLLECLREHAGIRWTAAPAPSPRPATHPRDVVAPPAAELAELVDLARIGDLEAIVERADALERSDESLRPLAAELRQLAVGFRIDEITALLDRLAGRA